MHHTVWFAALLLLGAPAFGATPFRVDVVDAETGWPVPLVELRTTHQARWFSDNAGAVAIDAPDLLGAPTWFAVEGHGYGVAADGFGYRGVRLTPRAGGRATVEVRRELPAKRLGRLTGAGLFVHAQRLGGERKWRDQGVFGCDTVQVAEHRGRLFWAWGDTTLPGYPLGLFDTLGATTDRRPLRRFEPPLRLRYDYHRDDAGRPRSVAPLPGDGPTWISGLVSLPEASGKPRLGAVYAKIEAPLAVYESGLCVWDEAEKRFERERVVWRRDDGPALRPPTPEGHATFWTDPEGERLALFGEPFPSVACQPTFESWRDPASWRVLRPQTSVPARDGGEVDVHRGSIAYSAYRGKWVAVFTQRGGDPSHLGEVWYAEADSPLGPWSGAVKVVTHNNYTFYNPRLHPELTPDDSPVLLFEGTYTTTFADKPEPTPRWDYNQVLYRLDLDDPALVGP